MSHRVPHPADSQELTDNEHAALMALVAVYGVQHIVELAQDMAAQLAENEEDDQ